MKLLFVIDVQNGFVSNKTQDVIPKILTLMDAFKGSFIISTKFINTENSGFTDIMHWNRLKQRLKQTFTPELNRGQVSWLKRQPILHAQPKLATLFKNTGLKKHIYLE